VVFNTEAGGFTQTGQNVTALLRLPPTPESPPVVRFFTDADLVSANAILTIARNDVGGLGRSTAFNFTVCAGDNYYTGIITDCVGPMTYTLDAPRFTASDGSVPAAGAMDLRIGRNPAAGAASPSQTGILLMYRDARKGREADPITVLP
jgi:hypothetical protein